MGPYYSTLQDVSEAEKQILPADTEFARRVYFGPASDQILCSIVLAGGEKRSIHRPEVCLPGQGWTINSSTVIPITLANGTEIEAMKLTLEREVSISETERIKLKNIFLYWFVGKNVTTARHEKRVWLTSWDRVVHSLNHRWAYVIVSSTVPPARSEERNAPWSG
ncbi:MAG: exosortase-associated EpsI family protein [Blastochloris sp.]|nr:exosortase-associated EpsI family protein [Blastochloris sp.]